MVSTSARSAAGRAAKVSTGIALACVTAAVLAPTSAAAHSSNAPVQLAAVVTQGGPGGPSGPAGDGPGDSPGDAVAGSPAPKNTQTSSGSSGSAASSTPADASQESGGGGLVDSILSSVFGGKKDQPSSSAGSQEPQPGEQVAGGPKKKEESSNAGSGTANAPDADGIVDSVLSKVSKFLGGLFS